MSHTPAAWDLILGDEEDPTGHITTCQPTLPQPSDDSIVFSASADETSHPADASGSQHACTRCDKSYQSRRSLLRHLRERHGGEADVPYYVRVPCPYCDETFQRKEGYEKHLRRFHTRARRPRPQTRQPTAKRQKRHEASEAAEGDEDIRAQFAALDEAWGSSVTEERVHPLAVGNAELTQEGLPQETPPDCPSQGCEASDDRYAHSAKGRSSCYLILASTLHQIGILSSLDQTDFSSYYDARLFDSWYPEQERSLRAWWQDRHKLKLKQLTYYFEETHQRLSRRLKSSNLSDFEAATSRLLRQHGTRFWRAKQDGFQCIDALFAGSLPSTDDINGFLGLAQVAWAMLQVVASDPELIESSLASQEKFLADLDRLACLLEPSLLPHWDYCVGVLWNKGPREATGWLGDTEDAADMLCYFKDLFGALMKASKLGSSGQSDINWDGIRASGTRHSGSPTNPARPVPDYRPPPKPSIHPTDSSFTKLVFIAAGAIFGILLVFYMLYCFDGLWHLGFDVGQAILAGEFASLGDVESHVISKLQSVATDMTVVHYSLSRLRRNFSAWLEAASFMTNIRYLELCLGKSHRTFAGVSVL